MPRTRSNRRSANRHRLPFGGPWAEGRSPSVNSRSLINWVPRKEDTAARATPVLYPSPGLSLLGTGGNGGCRGNGVAHNGSSYFAFGNSVVRIDANNVITEIGTLNTTDGPVSFAAGFEHVMVVDGVDGWFYDGTTFAQITDADFPVADYVTWSGQYFIVNSTGTSTFFISSPNDPSSWASLDQSTAERRADNIVRPIEFRGDLLLIGTETSELYFNSGNADFPWESYPNTVMEFGTQAPASVAIVGPNLFLLSNFREGGTQVLNVVSANPTIISTRDLEWAIGQMSTTSDAIGSGYIHDGHTYYQITFPSEGRTFVYDLIEKMWHERTSYVTAGKTKQGRHRCGGVVFHNGLILMGDYDTNSVYELKHEVYLENGQPIIRTCRAPFVSLSRRTVFHGRLELLFQPGVGLTTGQGSESQVMLRWSDDGGNTWGNELLQSLGVKGAYCKRVVWYQLGAARDRIYEISISDPVNPTLIDAFLDIRTGVD